MIILDIISESFEDTILYTFIESIPIDYIFDNFLSYIRRTCGVHDTNKLRFSVNIIDSLTHSFEVFPDILPVCVVCFIREYPEIREGSYLLQSEISFDFTLKLLFFKIYSALIYLLRCLLELYFLCVCDYEIIITSFSHLYILFSSSWIHQLEICEKCF